MQLHPFVVVLLCYSVAVCFLNRTYCWRILLYFCVILPLCTHNILGSAQPPSPHIHKTVANKHNDDNNILSSPNLRNIHSSTDKHYIHAETHHCTEDSSHISTLLFISGYYFNSTGLLVCEPFYSQPSYRILATCSLYFPTTMILMYCYGSSFHASNFRLVATPPATTPSSTSEKVSIINHINSIRMGKSLPPA